MKRKGIAIQEKPIGKFLNTLMNSFWEGGEKKIPVLRPAVVVTSIRDESNRRAYWVDVIDRTTTLRRVTAPADKHKTFIGTKLVLKYQYNGIFGEYQKLGIEKLHGISYAAFGGAALNTLNALFSFYFIPKWFLFGGDYVQSLHQTWSSYEKDGEQLHVVILKKPTTLEDVYTLSYPREIDDIRRSAYYYHNNWERYLVSDKVKGVPKRNAVTKKELDFIDLALRFGVYFLNEETWISAANENSFIRKVRFEEPRLPVSLVYTTSGIKQRSLLFREFFLRKLLAEYEYIAPPEPKYRIGTETSQAVGNDTRPLSLMYRPKITSSYPPHYIELHISLGFTVLHGDESGGEVILIPTVSVAGSNARIYFEYPVHILVEEEALL